ncbi:DUF6332 family protein [Streptomyces aurantiacus]|uniref:Uncharacterized protein n=1 Tax=Streptomyces aurantiacus JA 4570 TaxID=1286094 RepID=S3ZAK8_9ACTN|nr:DUF6332 family protein [Streptomyces aurantiacus]EPH40761.1 hypothetical protein STRAU_6180 [Streptomyces aurantiacus JA 4570]
MTRTTGQGRRSQAERDAMTVEIGYALVSATVVAVAVIGAMVAGPVIAFDLSAGTERVLLVIGCTLAAVAFVVRLVTVLWRFNAREQTGRRQPRSAQPSQPGRTRPDS